MVVPSFTSSSEKSMPGSGFPWAVAMAVLLILCVELVLHLVPPQALLGYGGGLGAYYEVRHSIEELGPAEISVLGTSRGRESVVMPMMARELEDKIHRPVTVANYSCPDAKSNEMLLVTRLMMASPTPPRIVFYFISPRGLLGDDPSIQREEVFGVFPNQYGENQAFLLASFSERSMWETRNFFQDHFYSFRYRYRFRNLMTSLPRGRQMLSPVQGEETSWQRYTANRSLESKPVNDQQIKTFVSRLLDDEGHYVLGQSRISALHEIARICLENKSQLILVSTPISEDLARNLPDNVLERFANLMSDFADQTGVPFITENDLDLVFGKDDFREHSHLNRRGAEKMTLALVEKILIPRMAVN